MVCKIGGNLFYISAFYKMKETFQGVPKRNRTKAGTRMILTPVVSYATKF